MVFVFLVVFFGMFFSCFDCVVWFLFCFFIFEVFFEGWYVVCVGLGVVIVYSVFFVLF